MEFSTKWKDYEIIGTGNGFKLERWGDVVLLRPDPQIIWDEQFDLNGFKGLNAKYERSNAGGGKWKIFKNYPEEWVIQFEELKFLVKPMGFKHTGLFPEQAVNWEKMAGLIKNANREIKVLNLFAYTGGATLACANAGAHVCHVDAARGMVERAMQNYDLSKIDRTRVRFIIDDCFKFVEKEIRRGKKYDAIIMDPPSYGRGPSGETWKIETGLNSLIKLTTSLLSEKPLFYLINSYTTGLQPQVLKNLLQINLKDFKGEFSAYEVGLPTNESIILPCGASGIFIGEN